MTDASLNNQVPHRGGKRIIFSPKYRDRRSKVRYNLFDGSESRNSPRKYIHRRTKGRYDLFDVSQQSDPYGSDIGVVDAVAVSVPVNLGIKCVDEKIEREEEIIGCLMSLSRHGKFVCDL